MGSPGPTEAARLLALGAADADALRATLEAAAETVARSSERTLDEHLDAIATPWPDGAARAATVVSSAKDLATRLARLPDLVGAGALRGAKGAYAGCLGRPARIGLAFPGQGAPVPADAAGLAGHPAADSLYARSAIREPVPDEEVQLAVVTSSLAALRVLEDLGLEAELALGHSLGELLALHWAGALGEEDLLLAARERGRAMVGHALPGGTMASVLADERALAALTADPGVGIACFNAPGQYSLSGPVEAIEAVVARARDVGARALPLKVTGAFHSSFMREAEPVFARHLETVALAPLGRTVVSSVTGAVLDPGEDLRALLSRQIVDPVRFEEAARAAASQVDLFVEVGPGKVLGGLIGAVSEAPVASVRSHESSGRGLLEVAAAAHAGGAGWPRGLAHGG